MDEANVGGLREPSRAAALILAFACALVLLATLIAATVNPLAGIVLAAAPALAFATYHLLRSVEAGYAVILAGAALVIISQDGVRAPELFYSVVLAGFLAYWYGSRLLRGERFCLGKIDYAIAILIFIFIPLGIIVGLGFGAPLADVRIDLMGFAPLALYFPVKHLCANTRYGAHIVGGVILWLGFYVSTFIFTNFHRVVTDAVLGWQIADARPGYNALQLTSGSIVALSLAIHVRRKLLSALFLGVFAYMMGALILIKYRAFWVAVVVGIVALALLARPAARRRLGAASLVGLILAGLLFYFVLGDLVHLFFAGTAARAATLGGLDQDLSLINRFWEAKFVLMKIAQNPILGYGFGTRYEYYSLIYHATFHVQHIHIGYVSPWFRLGLVGSILLFSVWLSVALTSVRLYLAQGLAHGDRVRPALAVAAAASLISIVPSALSESPWFVINQMLGFTLLMGLAMGLHESRAQDEAQQLEIGSDGEE